MKKNIYETLKEYSLSNEDIIKLINKNIISKEIDNVIFKEKDGGYVFYVEDKFPQITSDGYFYQWCPYLATLGIKLVFVEDDNARNATYETSIFITDFHLIVSKGARLTRESFSIYEKPAKRPSSAMAITALPAFIFPITYSGVLLAIPVPLSRAEMKRQLSSIRAIHVFINSCNVQFSLVRGVKSSSAFSI